ncbi:protein translocase subunit SecD [Ectothiorhodospiraceae bacterium BW-2]|nr:protein translocase subunit SecD [Ectothiorhodospiraceae bacterium BW-2]
MNQYPLWKYLLIAIFITMGAVYALPNLYGDDPALQITANRMAEIDETTRDRALQALEAAGLQVKSYELQQGLLLIRFADTAQQLQAYQVVEQALGENYTAALNLAPATPQWLRDVGALPMYLGLDLRGGVHFLMEVDMDAATRQAYDRYVDDLRTLLRENRLRYQTLLARHQEGDEGSLLELRFKDQAEREQAEALIGEQYRGLVLTAADEEGRAMLYATIDQQELLEIRKFALKQNITTLRNRVNELGVAEPVIQQQGDSRIVVQLPGIQDTARAKEILGATATLEYHMMDEKGSVEEALAGRVPPGSRLYRDRDGRPVLLYKRIIITGDQIIDASSSIDTQTGSPLVMVTLDSKGARKMSDNTRENVGKQMAVVYIENKVETKVVDGSQQKVRQRIEEVISIAVIREHFSKRFQTTGLDSTEEARNLALLLRAGALAAPIEIIEERTIGPSLGQENIDQGFLSVMVGFVLVLLFMAFWYRGFGLAANVALGLNLIFIVAVLSMLQATLTLPGIAGIVLTVGMAVDANVLIFERIREELRLGNAPQSAIHEGYAKAFSTIADANVTTLIAAVVLFGFGTGPIKGFAITLSIGIVTSMFTAIFVTRGLVNAFVSGKRIKSLSI